MASSVWQPPKQGVRCTNQHHSIMTLYESDEGARDIAPSDSANYSPLPSPHPDMNAEEVVTTCMEALLQSTGGDGQTWVIYYLGFQLYNWITFCKQLADRPPSSPRGESSSAAGTAACSEGARGNHKRNRKGTNWGNQFSIS